MPPSAPAQSDAGTSPDRSVFVRRRIFVLLGLLAVILTIVLIVVKPGSNSPASGAKDVAVPGDLSDKPAKAVGGDTPACDPGVLQVTALTDQASYGADEYPRLSLTVKNTGDATCIADLGTASMYYTIASGNDEVWRSRDCQTAPRSQPVILEPDEELDSDSVQWERTRSSLETCDISREPVISGGASYHLTASVGGATSQDSAQFLLY